MHDVVCEFACAVRMRRNNAELKQTTTATSTRTSPNKRFNEQNNSCARALQFFVYLQTVPCTTTGSLRKLRRQRQREHRWTKGLMSKTMAVDARYNSWYISLPSSAKQREMTKFCVVWRTWTTTANFFNLYSEFNTVFHIQFRVNFDSEKRTKWL